MLREYHVIYSVRYYPRFQPRLVLERFTREYGGTIVLPDVSKTRTMFIVRGKKVAPPWFEIRKRFI
jgi:hypothetical protein